MKLCYIFFFSLTMLLFSCGKNPGNNIKPFLNEANLPSQIFTINTQRDTTLLTSNGCIIDIPAQSLEADSSNVKLEIKEALHTTDIVLAGLTTMSGQQPLSSGGMIYINAASGYKITIKKQLKILVPTKTYNPGMQVYKGENRSNDKIDWQDPAPLPKDETVFKIEKGEAMFKASCANCHKIDADFNGPALFGITYRKPKKWLYDFTRDPEGISRTKDTPADTTAFGLNTGIIGSDSSKEIDYMLNYYSHCLKNQWNHVKMTAFPNLKDNDLDAIYSYIKTESDKRPDLKTKFGISCCDSCIAFGKAIRDVEMKRADLQNKMQEKDEEFFSLDREVPVPVTANTQAPPTTISAPAAPASTKVSPVSVKATFYTINIQAMGWYNIDILMKDYSHCVPSELFVRILGSYKIDVNVVLIIPSLKAFVEGGKLNDEEQYGFDEDNGKINLPQNAQCYVMAFAESDGKIIFGKTSFNTQQKQTIDIALAATTKENMQAQIKAMNLDAVKLEIKEDSTAVKIKSLNQQMEELKKLQPKNCSCGFDK